MILRDPLRSTESAEVGSCFWQLLKALVSGAIQAANRDAGQPKRASNRKISGTGFSTIFPRYNRKKFLRLGPKREPVAAAAWPLEWLSAQPFRRKKPRLHVGLCRC